MPAAPAPGSHPPPPDRAPDARTADVLAELAPLAERHAALTGALAAAAVAADDETRARLRAEIGALYREVRQRARALEQLEAGVRDLAERWKALPAPTPASTPAPASPPGAATVRVDHLGASTFVAKGWSHLAAGDGHAAERELRQALALAPGESEAAALLAWALLAQDRVDDAFLAAQQALAAHPDSALARVGVGHACLRRGIFGEAIEHLARAVRDGTDRKATLYGTFYLGVVYLRREMYDDAVAFFRRALALGPNLVEAHYETGRAHWFAGDAAAADEAWRAGAEAGKFSAWGARCERVREVVRRGGVPPALTDAIDREDGASGGATGGPAV